MSNKHPPVKTSAEQDEEGLRFQTMAVESELYNEAATSGQEQDIPEPSVDDHSGEDNGMSTNDDEHESEAHHLQLCGDEAEEPRMLGHNESAEELGQVAEDESPLQEVEDDEESGSQAFDPIEGPRVSENALLRTADGTAGTRPGAQHVRGPGFLIADPPRNPPPGGRAQYQPRGAVSTRSEDLPEAMAVQMPDDSSEAREALVESEVDRIRRDEEAMRNVIGGPVAVAEPASAGRVLPVGDENDIIQDSNKEAPSPRWSRKQKNGIISVIVVVTTVAVAVGVSLGVSNSRDNHDGTPQTPPHSTLSPIDIREELVREVVTNVSSQRLVNDPRSPQHDAFVWLVENDTSTDLLELSKQKLLQRYIIATLYFATMGAGWRYQLNFLSDGKDECEWNGVNDQGTLMGIALCDEELRATELTILENNMTGTLPEELGYLTTLKALRIIEQQMEGSIPRSITNLTSLNKLYLFENGLTGSLPEDVGKLSMLDIFNVQGNKLSGTIPGSIGDTTSLSEFYLTNNQFSGTLPESMGKLSLMRLMFLNTNQLSGIIPTSLSSMSSVESVVLYQNNFVGGMDTFCNISSLSFFAADCFVGPYDRPREVNCCCCSDCYRDGNPDGVPTGSFSSGCDN